MKNIAVTFSDAFGIADVSAKGKAHTASEQDFCLASHRGAELWSINFILGSCR